MKLSDRAARFVHATTWVGALLLISVGIVAIIAMAVAMLRLP